MWKRTKVSKILLWERVFGIHTGLNKAKRQFLSHSPPSNVFYSQVNYTSVPRILPVHEVDAARLIHLAAPEAHWLLLGRRDRSEPKKAEVPIYKSRVAAFPPPSPVAGDTRLAFRVRFIISISWLSFTQVFYFSLFFWIPRSYSTFALPRLLFPFMPSLLFFAVDQIAATGARYTRSRKYF